MNNIGHTHDHGAESGQANSGLVKLWSLMGAERPKIILAMVFRLAQSFSLGMAYGAVLWVVLGLIEGREITRDWLLQVVLLMALSLAGQLLFSYLSVRYSWSSSYRLSGQLRHALLEHFQRLPMGFHLTRQRGDLANTITSDPNMIEAFLADSLPRLVQALAMPFAVFAFMAQLDWRLACIMGASIVVAFPVLLLSNRWLARLGLVRQDQQAEASSRMIEYVLGIKVIRAFGHVDKGNAHFERALTDFRDISKTLVTSLVAPFMLFIIIVMLGIPTVYFAIGMSFDTMSPSIAVVALVLVFSMYGPIAAVLPVIEMLRMADASLIRINRVLDEQPLPQAESVHAAGYRVCFDQVGFAYNAEKPVLMDVSFTVPENTMTAIVGHSGSGKSTILNLLARFWDVNSGKISIGGAPVGALPPEELQELVSFVFQDVYLFSGTIRDNIAIGRNGATEAEIIAAAQKAQAHDFIMHLPQGYDTQVGEGGARMSGGERQRIAIARAIVKDAPIVLLDEATAAIDPINERALQMALAALVADRSFIVVAHKLSTIEAADQILVLDQGQIAQRGTHDTLLEEDGIYRQLIARKSSAQSWTITPHATKD